MKTNKKQRDNYFADWLIEHADSPEVDIVLEQLLESSQDLPDESRKGFESFVQKSGITRRYDKAIVFKVGFVCLVITSVVLGWLLLAEQRDIEYKEVCTAFGKTTIVSLEDGTTVKLGGGSKLVYPEVFKKDIRKIYLEGDAFLNVAHNTSWPFIVSAGSMDIHVLGPRFNVSTGLDRLEDEVALVEGSVNISFKDGDNQSLKLAPGEMLKIDRVNGKKEIKSFVVNYYNSLSDESGFFFYDVTLREIAETLSLRSGIPIIICDNELAEKKYYAMFINEESVYDILKSLNFKNQFKVSITMDTIYINSNNSITNH